MRKTLLPVTLSALLLAGCSSSNEAPTEETATPTAEVATTEAATPTQAPSETPVEENIPVGETMTYVMADNSEFGEVTLRSAEIVTGQCETTWAVDPEPGNELLKLDLEIAIADNESVRNFADSNGQVHFLPQDFVWENEKGFKQQNVWGSNASQYCDEPTNRYAQDLKPGEKTQGSIVLEVNSKTGVLKYGSVDNGWIIQ